MLGELDFKVWQCLCELIDNSMDSFTQNAPVDSEKIITIEIPSSRFRTHEHLRIVDNGSGMNEAQLTQSLKAGFSNNTNASESKLGLFGMGFNVATARLGERTQITTATAESEYKTQVIIDFREINSSGFITKGIRIPKLPNEKDWHGTEIVVSELKKDHCKGLRQQAKLRSKLGKIYGRVLRERGIQLIYDGSPCAPFKHCVWSEHRKIEHNKFGSVPALININKSLKEKRFCNTCWIWLSDQDPACPACSSLLHVITRKRTVKGWIGIQRYFDKKEYGFDLIRNGRVIKEWDKSLFFVSNPDNDEDEKEYPIDGRATEFGRIVGELEIDFIATTYAKDAFEKNSADWKEFVEVVRGVGPIRPNIAKARGYNHNDSPLARLYSVFKGQTAGSKNLVPYQRGSDRSALITNDAEMNRLISKFRENVEDYQSDDKWWELIKRGDEKGVIITGEVVEPSKEAGLNPFLNDPSKDPKIDRVVIPKEEPDDDEASLPQTIADVELSQPYEIPSLRAVVVHVIALRFLEGSHPNGFHVIPKGRALEFHYWPENKIFRESLYTPADMLINELSVILHTAAQKEIGEVPISKVELELRDKYFPTLQPNELQLKGMADGFADSLQQYLIAKIKDSNSSTEELLDPKDIQICRDKLIGMGITSDADINKMFSSGSFLEGSSITLLGKIVEKNPQLVFDECFFNTRFESLTESQFFPILQDFAMGISDLSWLYQNNGPRVQGIWRGRQLRARAALEIFGGWQTSQS
ncbi:ATP-binding protein [Akkermansiaceae bacterium]|nr:ATP-binding protein [Akkermansiaceae bacterium]MDA8958547.1 ATP-binding protein [bacterium]MDB4761905.1 ATP-binding protein [bacterium]MDB4782592.1 ATP-binding protein [Akkermansiaceae bacterium]